MAVTNGPNPIAVAWSVLSAQRLRRPRPNGTGTVDHGLLAPVLAALQAGGVTTLAAERPRLHRYRDHIAATDPDSLGRSEALAYWLNLYNAGALDVAAAASVRGDASVLRVPGAFRSPWVSVAGEALSLDAIEHGKIRRFGDPRIHGALVCGSASCPTLRYEPYDGAGIDRQLDDQLRRFLTSGGAVTDTRSGVLRLSRVFLWYGGDVTRPHRMPTWLPPRRRALASALLPWLDDETAEFVREGSPRVTFQDYDWSLACTIG